MIPISSFFYQTFPYEVLLHKNPPRGGGGYIVHKKQILANYQTINQEFMQYQQLLKLKEAVKCGNDYHKSSILLTMVTILVIVELEPVVVACILKGPS